VKDMKFSENVKKHRVNNGLTQEQLAKKLFVTKQAISKWETGKGYPDASTLPSIAEVLDISIDQLMGTNEKRNMRRSIQALKISIISAVLLILIIVLAVPLVRNYNNAQSIKEIEKEVSFGLPKYGDITSSDLENWEVYGNTIPISRMSYIIFENDKTLIEFEEEISVSNEWNKEISNDLLIIIPNEIQSYLEIGDNFRLLNISSSSINLLPSTDGDYDFILLIYQNDYSRLLIFEYSLTYKGGQNEG
jgi:transcriptional regulator with XRE-family HTH domain